MLRRNILRLGGGGGGKSSTPSITYFSKPGAALGLGDEPIFRASKFFRPVDHPEVSSKELASEGVRTGRDAAAASIIDYIELQWLLWPYRFRKLVLEVQEVRRIGVVASLPECKLTLLFNVFLMVAVYLFGLWVGRGYIINMRWPKQDATATSVVAEKKEEAKH